MPLHSSLVDPGMRSTNMYIPTWISCMASSVHDTASWVVILQLEQCLPQMFLLRPKQLQSPKVVEANNDFGGSHAGAGPGDFGVSQAVFAAAGYSISEINCFSCHHPSPGVCVQVLELNGQQDSLSSIAGQHQKQKP